MGHTLWMNGLVGSECVAAPIPAFPQRGKEENRGVDANAGADVGAGRRVNADASVNANANANANAVCWSMMKGYASILA